MNFFLYSNRLSCSFKFKTTAADVTQLVECNFAKIKDEGSNPSICFYRISGRVV